MAPERYDSEWKEVRDINAHVLIIVYLSFMLKGLAYLVFTWNTVVLLGGFVSMIDKLDFRRLTAITIIQIFWINDSFSARLGAAVQMSLSSYFQAFPESIVCHPELPVVKQFVAIIWALLSIIRSLVIAVCISGTFLMSLLFGLGIAAWISIRGLMEHDHYGDKDEDRINMDPAHNIMYAMCVLQFALFLCRLLFSLQGNRIAKRVSKAYGFRDDGRAVRGYLHKIRMECSKNPSSARGSNLITYAVELMKSKSPLTNSFRMAILILDRLLTRGQHPDKTKASCSLIEQEENQEQQSGLEEDEIIEDQRMLIKYLLSSASSTDILENLLHTLDPRHKSDPKMRQAAARIVEQVAEGIHLDQLPRGIPCISSLINTFEDYITSYLLMVSDDHQPSPSKALHGYKALVLTGLRILWRLAGCEENCAIISNDKHLIYKIMAPVSYDLVHRAGHSSWSTMVVGRSLGVILRLIVTSKGADVGLQMSNNEAAITSMERIVTCDQCKGGELQMKTMQILTQLCVDESHETANVNVGNLIKVLASIFIDGASSSNGAIRKTAGETLVVLFLGSKSAATLLPKEENDEFVGDLAKILVQVGDNDSDAFRKIAAEILEHLCIHYAKNGEYLSTLKNAMTGVMPEVLDQILLGCGSTQKGIRRYTRSGADVENQVITNNDMDNNSSTSTCSTGNEHHHKLHVALLSLCVTACEKLHLDLDAIWAGGGDQARHPGDGPGFSLATTMVQVNRELITTDSLTTMKLTTRMVIAAMKKLRDHDAIIQPANLDSLIDSLSSISETMLDLEGSMVFTARTTAIPGTTDTLDSLVKQARQLHNEIKGHGSETVPAS